ncbi:MAG: nucleotidyltransferase substrate binding protein [Puniceicoccales bacterium]|jgi:nucleotidyltransferase substrate binding protein (TIGR01987 family)|nr:nucleotidyltransferase substrate binding protein [Puniceicoccales bacterium]
MLDLTPLQDTIASLERAIAVGKQVHGADASVREVVQAGIIQNFEIVYEMCWKFMQRWLRVNQSNDIDHLRTRKDLFRLAARHQLIRDPQTWFLYGEARNLTSRTYQKEQATKIYHLAPQFLLDAQFLLQQIECMND